MKQIKSDDVVQRLISEKSQVLENKLKGEVILIRAPMAASVDDLVRREVEILAAQEKRSNRLIVVLETSGGSVEVVERIHDVFREYFQEVYFIIPNSAYSAGTVLALSGDEIYMDYYSVLGPIDPQIRSHNDRWVPGIGYLEKYQELIRKSAEDTITTAEMEFLVRKFDPAELFALEQARLHSVNLICDWLPKYKFKNWTVRETSRKKVTLKCRKERAEEIAKLLGDPTEWKTHGRGISLRTLCSEKIKLKVKNFGRDKALNVAIREYYDLFVDYCSKRGNEFAIHTKHRLKILV
ncbi:MAG: ATP-dependent Clp protease proteolytic subunit [Aestuariivita sp.]|nr:ATP-dependent Clp protease proteolytic subunit [Aestuariivita sp.]MCY4204051.1 ATP-dependent Clp protease proteolytic subunit [Aestuariivita sp.]